VGLSVVGTIGEHQINQPQFAVDLDNVDQEPLPGMAKALTGIPIDAKDLVIELDVPADYKDEQIRGAHAKLTVTVLEVRQKDVPTLDDEFAKDTGKADTLDGLKAALRKDLEGKEQVSIDREAREGALRELIKKNQIPVASSLVERSVEMQYQRLRQMLGMKPERGNPGLTDDLRDKMRPAGADEVRGQLLLEAIADKEGLTVTDEALQMHIEDTAKARNTAPAKLRAEWQRDGRLDNITYSLRQDKTLKYLVEHAKITEVEKLTQPAPPIPTAQVEDASGHVHGPDCDHDH
jgi:trigger factor